MQSQSLFIVLRSNLTSGDKIAQSSHITAQWLLDNPNQNWNNQRIVCLQCEDLDKFKFKLDLKEVKYSKFTEPDMDNIVTGIAFDQEGTYLKKLKLAE